MIRATFVLWAACLVGCAAATAGEPSLEAAKARNWLWLESPHFSLLTDVESGEARRIIAAFEGYFAAMAQAAEEAMFASTHLPTEKIDVTVFERARDYDTIAPPDTKGFFFAWREGEKEKSRVFVTASLDAQNQRTLKHELCHRFVHHFLPDAPAWLDEGLAQYFATFAVEDGRLLIGRPDPDRVFVGGDNVVVSDKDVVNAMRLPAAAEVLAAENERFSHFDTASDYYAASWLLVHLLMTDQQYEKPWNDYLKRLAGGEKDEDARRAAFRAVDLGALDAAYRRSALAKERTLWKLKALTLEAPPARVQSMDRAAMKPHWDTWAQFRQLWEK